MDEGLTTQDRINHYIKTHCPNCKNRHKFVCDIRIINNAEGINTRCLYYERIENE